MYIYIHTYIDSYSYVTYLQTLNLQFLLATQVKTALGAQRSQPLAVRKKLPLGGTAG